MEENKNMKMKKCRICSNEFEANTDNFYKNKSSPDGLSPYCKECEKAKSFQWTKNNKEKRRIIQRRSNERRKEIRDEDRRQYRIDGKQRKWQQNNKDKIKEYNAKRQNKNHKISKKEWEQCLEFFNYKCAYCEIHQDEAKIKYKNYLHKEHVDHEGSNQIDNCIPACKGCNASKGAKKLDDWYNGNNHRFTRERYDNIIKWLDQF